MRWWVQMACRTLRGRLTWNEFRLEDAGLEREV
jgi:hypothetical protein